MASDDITRMGIAEFREAGYVQEINRLLLHPLGLALEVQVYDDHEYELRLNDEEVEQLAHYSQLGGPLGAFMATLHGAVVAHEADEERLGGVWDYREDPEGIRFGGDYLAAMSERAETVAREWIKRKQAREEALGYVVQPVENDAALGTIVVEP
jgi:hypothetical protein